jgi:formyl-CoA transferase
VTGPSPAGLPLAGVRVVDVGTRIAAPFCAALLGELGADVVKVEDPGTGDVLRDIGPFVDGTSLFWAVEGRGKRSVTCDLRDDRGQHLFRRLVATADVLVENFRPGTLERWGLGPERLDPSLVIVRISVFGQSGPAADRPGLDLVALAAAGLLAISGYPDGPPTKSGITVADHLTGAFAAQAALAALVERQRTGRGTVIDAPLHASVLRVLEWTVAANDRLGLVRARTGGRGPHEPPSGVREAGDGRFVAAVADSAAAHTGLAALLGAAAGDGGTAHADAPDPDPAAADALARALDEWVADRPAHAAVAALTAAGVPAAVVATTADVATDPGFRGGGLVTVDDQVLGPLLQQGPFPRWPGAPPPGPAPGLGQHNEEIWCGEVGLTAGELAALRAGGVV